MVVSLLGEFNMLGVKLAIGLFKGDPVIGTTGADFPSRVWAWLVLV